jgi:hypothetical protein
MNKLILNLAQMSGIVTWKWEEKALPLLSIGSRNIQNWFSTEEVLHIFSDRLEEKGDDSFTSVLDSIQKSYQYQEKYPCVMESRQMWIYTG